MIAINKNTENALGLNLWKILMTLQKKPRMTRQSNVRRGDPGHYLWKRGIMEVSHPKD